MVLCSSSADVRRGAEVLTQRQRKKLLTLRRIFSLTTSVGFGHSFSGEHVFEGEHSSATTLVYDQCNY